MTLESTNTHSLHRLCGVKQQRYEGKNEKKMLFFSSNNILKVQIIIFRERKLGRIVKSLAVMACTNAKKGNEKE